ncbi:response regulator transcription factor [Campylobacter sp. RM9344]|uniref:Response regulator transcription factor n=1 Tax=Campylobacter californiensis TaxID=1032243 RepID=A0AAW3ZWX7_9BACT|nr:MULTISPECIES: response regulator transcription factor [unclassified Campylobacter]MBE2984536.1 response regulator transcription factor [Campylobacter sp. RM6883]MBE2985876.1 response regulator transcription factor [Campylobacter sp. RM12919]MBE2988939.1 response regulator transcription factor [Campylobacter sp. RM12920]MBE2994934.1 response regulator transcription factor [Campylobacter sp. RM6913]MBE3028977.1 response regulator transcription factor [Campylobacter sp. RM9344]
MNTIFKELSRINVLLVEDDLHLRDVIKELVEPYVGQIFKAQNGKDGLEIFSQNDINLIITDINMTSMNGIKMVKHIRKLDEQTPIIFITAYDTDENLQNLITIQNSSLLKKPFDKQQLLITMLMVSKNGIKALERLNLGQGFSYDIQSRTLYSGDENIALTKTEQRLLHILAINKDRVVSFEMIENFTWSGKVASFDTMRNYINKLRNKTYATLIKNIQGIGYKLSLCE